MRIFKKIYHVRMSVEGVKTVRMFEGVKTVRMFEGIKTVRMFERVKTGENV